MHQTRKRLVEWQLMGGVDMMTNSARIVPSRRIVAVHYYSFLAWKSVSFCALCSCSLSTWYRRFKHEKSSITVFVKFLTQGLPLPLSKKSGSLGQFGGSDQFPRPILTWKCLEALTGKMLICASMLSAFNTIKLWSGKARGLIYNLPKFARPR